MKINAHKVHSSSDHTMTELAHSFSREQRSETRVTPSIPDPLAPSILLDRVSLSVRESQTRQAAFRARLTSSSRVGASPEKERVFDQTHVLEQLVGGAIDREVVIRNLSRGQDYTPAQNAQVPGDLGSSQGVLETWEARFTQTHVEYEEEQMAFFSKGRLTTEDGREIEFDLALEMDRFVLSRVDQERLLQGYREKVVLVDPLMVNLEGGIPALSQSRFEFDLDNDGEMETLHTAAAGSGFLALDRNGDGVINNGGELFGPATGNGFQELAQWDVDGNQWIDENDPVFDQLKVWRRDGEGNEELISLKAAGMGAIHLENAITPFSHESEGGKGMGQVRRSGIFLFEDGRAGLTQQVDLAVVADPFPGAKELDARELEALTAMENHQAGIKDAMETLRSQIESLRRSLHEQLVARARNIFSQPVEGIGILSRMDPLGLVAAHRLPSRFLIKG